MITFHGKEYATWADAKAAKSALEVSAPTVLVEAPTVAKQAVLFDAPPKRPAKRLPMAERYRPARLSQVVGQDRAIRQIRMAIADNGGTAGGLAWWISGESGQGKTTIARCIAATIANPEFIDERDAGAMIPSDIDAMQERASMFGWGKGGRAFILNESHGLRRDTVRRLLVALEPIPAHICWIFTTTSAGMDKFEDDHIDAGPLLSRCQVIALNADTAAPAFARLAQRVARREHLDGQPLEAYVKLVQGKRGNMRAVYQSIAGGMMMD